VPKQIVMRKLLLQHSSSLRRVSSTAVPTHRWNQRCPEGRLILIHLNTVINLFLVLDGNNRKAFLLSRWTFLFVSHRF
jgi:hypothetical protein